MSKMNILFSPPDITEEEIEEVVDTLKSGWITTGPKTKLFEQNIAKFLQYKQSGVLEFCNSVCRDGIACSGDRTRR